MMRATLLYLFVGTYVLLLAPLALIWTFVIGDVSLLFRMARICIRTGGWICGIRVRIEGRENIQAGKTYVFLSNHQSNCDGPVLMHCIPRDLRALIKKEMMRLPVLSWVLQRVRFVPIERLNPKQAHVGIEQGARLLGEGVSFFAFPEGTRSRDGRLGVFKKGVFIMAIKAQVPVVPISILDSAKILAPGRYGIRPGCIHVQIHAPIETAGLTLEDRNQLVQQVREAILAPLAKSSEDGPRAD